MNSSTHKIVCIFDKSNLEYGLEARGWRLVLHIHKSSRLEMDDMTLKALRCGGFYILIVVAHGHFREEPVAILPTPRVHATVDHSGQPAATRPWPSASRLAAHRCSAVAAASRPARDRPDPAAAAKRKTG